MTSITGSPRHTVSLDDTERRCIATGAAKDTSEMIRFVIGPEDRVVPDLARKLPGRGLWLTATRDAVELAVKKRRFNHAARRPVQVDDDLADRLEALLARRCIDGLGLARRAGDMVAGYEKVRAVLAGGSAGCLITARDASADGRDKLRRQAGATPGAIPFVDALTVAELSLAIGRENVVHAALTRGKLTDRFLSEAGRLAGFRSSDREARSNELEQV